jgi:hypothetical protein
LAEQVIYYINNKKLGQLFTESQLEKNLDFVVKMGYTNKLPFAHLCSSQEIFDISDDPSLIAQVPNHYPADWPLEIRLFSFLI